MSIATLVLGESGTGKSASLRNLDPKSTLLIQPVKKPLPFRSPGWGYFDRETNKTGNIFVSDQSAEIIALMERTARPVIVIDDFQYVLANEYMRRTAETGYGKFTDIAKHAWEIFNAANALPADKRVYFLSHTAVDEGGITKIKTIGRMLDEKITVEGLFTIVLRTLVVDQQYLLSTRNNGSDTVKSPMQLFESERIDNDLEAVDVAICRYYDIPAKQLQAA